VQNARETELSPEEAEIREAPQNTNPKILP
jgi:hypothetical protein